MCNISGNEITKICEFLVRQLNSSVRLKSSLHCFSRVKKKVRFSFLLIILLYFILHTNDPYHIKMKKTLILLFCCGVVMSTYSDFKEDIQKFRETFKEAQTSIQGTIAAPLTIWIGFGTSLDEMTVQPELTATAKLVPQLAHFRFFADMLYTLHLANSFNGQTIPFSEHSSVVYLTALLAQHINIINGILDGNANQKLSVVSDSRHSRHSRHSRTDTSDALQTILSKCKKLRYNLDEALHIIMKYDTLGSQMIHDYHMGLMQKLEAAVVKLNAALGDRVIYASELKIFVSNLKAIGDLIVVMQLEAMEQKSGAFYLVSRLIMAYEFPYLTENFALMVDHLVDLSAEKAKNLTLHTAQIATWTENVSESRKEFESLKANLDVLIANEANESDELVKLEKRKVWLKEVDKVSVKAFAEPLNAIFDDLNSAESVKDKKPKRPSLALDRVGRSSSNTEESLASSKAP